MATELAPVTPAVLRWARESIGASLDDAAKRAGVTAERIAAWEAGTSEPTVAMLRALAKLYQRPIAIFFLPEPPKTFDAMRDFRQLPEQQARAWSRALHKVYRRAIEQQEIVTELAQAEGETLLARVPALDLAVPPEEAAATAREALGVSVTDQHSWRHPDHALAGWIEAIEHLGVFVLRTSDVEMHEMRGFSVSGGDVPVIVLNALDWPKGQIFTLLHEFAHLTIREGGLCDLLEPDSQAARRVEAWCNATAGAILLPASSLLDNEMVGPPGEREWDDEILAHLSGRYGASQEAILRRLVTLNRASRDRYLAKRAQYLEAYEEQRANQRARRREKPGGPLPYRVAIRDRGRPYIRLVLDAYQRDVISPSSVSALLGLKLKHLAALEREVNA